MNLKFGLIQASYWMTYCVMFTYLVPLYESFGYGEFLSGVIAMIGTAVLTAAQPLWGVLCDRVKRIKPVLVAVLLAGAGAALLLPLGNGSVAVTVTAVVLLAATTQSLMYLFDTWSARLQREGARLSFGLTRSCGSVFYALTAAFFGLALDRFGFSIMTPVFIGLSLCVILAVLAVKEPRQTSPARETEGAAQADFWPAVKRLMTDRRYLCLLVATFLTFFGSTGIMLFLPLRVAEIGGGNYEYGLALLVMAFSEVPALLLYRRFSARFSTWTLHAAALFFTAVKVAAIALAPSLWLLIALMVVQGPSNGVYLTTNVRYVPEIVEPQLTYTAQTVIGAVASGAAGIASSLYMGAAVERFGLQTAMITLIFIAFSGFLVFAAPVLARRKGGKKKHDQPDFQL